LTAPSLLPETKVRFLPHTHVPDLDRHVITSRLASISTELTCINIR
jgi:hypothetical protein